MDQDDWRRERRLTKKKKETKVLVRTLVALGTIVLAGVAVLVYSTTLSDGKSTKSNGKSTQTTAPATTTTTAKHPRPTKPITIQWVGDLVLASSYGTPPNGGRDSLRAVRPSLRKGDFTWGNLEETSRAEACRSARARPPGPASPSRRRRRTRAI